MRTDEHSKRIMDRFGIRELKDVSGQSPAKTYDTGTGYFLKTDEAGELRREYEMTDLFHSFGMAPEAAAFVTDGKDFLLTRKAEGNDLVGLKEEPESVCRILAFSLKALHSRPAEGVPVSTRFLRFTEYAGRGCQDCLCDTSVLLKRFPIGSAEEAREIIRTGAPLLRADTLIHGDPCLPNVMQKDGAFVSFIDLNMAGAGDRHIDLYWALWSLEYNLKTDAYDDLFLDLYGREKVSEDTLKTIAAFEYAG